MNWMKKLFGGGKDPQDVAGYWVFVRCDQCGEFLATRIDLQNDLSAQYEGGEQSYFIRKVLVGSKGCFQRIEIELTLDGNKKLTNREIQGGRFLRQEEYQQGAEAEQDSG